MKIEGRLFAFGAAFYFLVAIAYWLISKDEFGFVALLFTGVMALMVAFYILYTAKRVFPRPEDRKDALISEADPDYGQFSPHSWWPLPLAASAATIGVGLVFAAWLVVFGVVAVLVSVFGLVFEHYRGDHAH